MLPIWKKRLDARTLVTTPNSDVIYAMSTLTWQGWPAVLRGAAIGILLDFWQRPIPVDGAVLRRRRLPGPDGGKGGKFLFPSPGYAGEVPEGY